MEMVLRSLKPEERSYTYTQSQQIGSQAGCIGHLRADMDSGGNGFFSSWTDFRSDLKTQEFKDEFDDVIRALRTDSKYEGILKNRSLLSKYCYSHPACSFDNECDFGIRVDTVHYAYLMRLNPARGEYNLYCYCYHRDWLDHHLSQARRGIRFITSDYQDKFHIEDGDQVRIHYPDGGEITHVCRYVDDYHMETAGRIYHICEFAEQLKKENATVIPIRASLPEQCYSTLRETGEIIILKRGMTGYYKTDIPFTSRDDARALVDEYNRKLGVTKQQEHAMQAGSLFGFQVPAADPKTYSAEVKKKTVPHPERGEAR